MGTSSRPFAALAAAALVSFAAQAQAEPPSAPAKAPPIPTADEATYPPPNTGWTVAAAGLGTSAFFYGTAVGASYLFPDAPGMRELRTPLVGPWLAIGKEGCRADDLDCSDVLVVARVIVTALNGAAQAAGLAIMLEGLFLPTQEQRPAVRRSPSTPQQPQTPPSSNDKNLFLLPTPMTVGARGIGVGVIGQF